MISGQPFSDFGVELPFVAFAFADAAPTAIDLIADPALEQSLERRV